MNNLPKYKSYKFAFSLLNDAIEKKDLALCIASVAIAESIISDRCLSFLNYFDKESLDSQKGKYIGINYLLKNCKKHRNKLKINIKRKNGQTFISENLFGECLNWLKERNDIIHGFAKSNPGIATISIEDFQIIATKAATNGLKYSSLVKKWHQQEMRNSIRSKLIY
jgi:hypothetical protein